MKDVTRTQLASERRDSLSRLPGSPEVVAPNLIEQKVQSNPLGQRLGSLCRLDVPKGENLKDFKRAAAVSASAVALLATALATPAQANGEVSKFRIDYGSSYVTGKVTWFNQSVKVEGKMRVASHQHCLDAQFEAAHNNNYGNGASGKNCGSGNYAFNDTIPFKHAGGPSKVTVEHRRQDRDTAQQPRHQAAGRGILRPPRRTHDYRDVAVHPRAASAVRGLHQPPAQHHGFAARKRIPRAPPDDPSLTGQHLTRECLPPTATRGLTLAAAQTLSGPSRSGHLASSPRICSTSTSGTSATTVLWPGGRWRR